MISKLEEFREFDDIAPGGESYKTIPEKGLRLNSFMITGRVFDQATTGLGRGLYVSAYQHDTDSLVFKKKVFCKADGSYSIKFWENEIINLNYNNPLELFVYQGNTQLPLVNDGQIIVSATQPHYLKDLFIATRSSVKGVVKRKNFVNAAGCLVELYKDTDNDTTTATLIDGAMAFTNINGEYKIPYVGDEKNSLRLKFYNNEDIVSKTVDVNVSELGDTPSLIVEEVVPSNGNSYSEGEWFEVYTASESKVYEYISDAGSGNVNAKLVSWTDESTSLEKFFYKREFDNNNYYLVLDKKVVYSFDGKSRVTYIRVPESFSTGSPTLHDKITETYNSYWSPQMVTANQEEEVNYLFTNNTLDEYTRIINREEEFIAAKASSGSTIPTRSRLKGYNAEETSSIASLIGATEEDVQSLSQARDFNSQMKLDHEMILFGLAKKSVKLDMAVFFSMSERNLKLKIEEAVKDNFIPAQDDVQSILDEIKARLIEIVSNEFTDLFKGVTDTKVMAVINDSTKKGKFIRCMAQYSYDNKVLDAEFWSALSLDALEEQQLRRTVQYSEICNSNEIFINRFVVSGALQPFSVVLNKTKAEIEAEITPEVLASEDVPEGVSTKSEYATFIYDKIEELFATESLFYDLANTSFTIEGDTEFTTKFNLFRTKLITESENSNAHFYDILFGSGHTFNIEKGPVRDYLEISGVDTALTSFYSALAPYGKQDWINFMTLIQRVYSITSEGKFETIKALIEKGYHSAYDIVKDGRSNLINKMQGRLDDAKCIKIYKASEYKVNKALVILNKYSGNSSSGTPIVVKDKKLVSGNETKVQLLSLPEMSMLFGDQDVTDTKHGESVLGPAAYLVDVLNVLKQFKVSDKDNEKTLYDKLILRRPDITKIPLNCANAITPLPYIDLVMEILEDKIHELEELPEDPAIKYDTTKTEEQLKTDPEYKRYAVYEIIKNAAITNWLRKPLNLFSEELKLYAKTLGINRTKLAEPYYKNVSNAVKPYFDVLGLSYGEVINIDGKRRATGDLALFPATTLATYDVLDFTADAIVADPKSIQASFLVKEFLENTSMTLSEFNDLLGSYYVNPNVTDGQDYQRFNIHFRGKQELSTTYMEFASLDVMHAFIMRMYQFRHLLNATGWTVPVLDAVLLSGNEYEAYYNVAQTNNNLITSGAVERIGKAKMNQDYLDLTDNQVSTIFSKAVIYDYEGTSSFIKSTFIENDLAEEHKETFTEWLSFGKVDKAPLDELAYSSENVPNVFMEYLKDAMNLNEGELLALSSLLEQNAENHPKLTARGVQNMITAWQLAEGFGLEIEELVSYCQLIQFKTNLPLVDSIEMLTNAQKTVIANQTNVLELLFLLYHQGTDKELQDFEDKALKIVNNIIEKREEYAPKLEEGKSMTPEDKDALITALKPVVEEQLNNTTGLDLAFVSKVLALKTIDGKEVASYVADPGNDESSVVKNKLAAVIKYCLKGLSFCELMGIELVDIDHISNSPVSIFDLPMNAAQALFIEDFNKFSAICQAGQYLIEGKNRFEFYNQVISTDKANMTLSDYIDWAPILTDWKHNDELEGNKYNSKLNWFLQAGEINQFLNRYDIASSDAIKLIKWNWADITEAKASVTSMATIAQTKTNAAIYAAEMTAGRNKLRTKQRDALVQYLFEKERSKADPQFATLYDLYAYFLIDTQMTPAVSSSRILQATLAVQSFIQRVQLGLETDVVFTKKDAKKWEWMSLYRVWEANRKIFLYPENWLEPELRDNKSPFFKELEKELTGKEITKEAIESSYMDYVSKFEQVANIEICQLYNEEHDNFSVLHVIGRSRFEPHEYFYRKLINESYWTPWEKMGIEINTDHIAPAIIKDRLVAFWLECTDVAKEPSDEDLSVVNPKEGSTIAPKRAQKQLQMQVCWSELIDNKWTRKRKCDETVKINDLGTKDKFDFRLVYEAGDTNYLHILNAPQSFLAKKNGVTFSVECFNHIHLTKESDFKGTGYVMPEGMSTYGQKAQMNNAKNWLSLPVAATNGVAYVNNVVENIKGQTRLVYPHQYKNFISNAPFVVETNMQSVVFIPTVKAERSSVLLKKVMKFTYTQPKFRPKRNWYRTDYSCRYRNEERYYREDRYYNDWRREERSEYKMPHYFTHDHEHLSVIKQTPTGRVIAFEKEFSHFETILSHLKMPKSVVFKPEMKASLAYHPYMETLRSNLQKYGIDGILDPLGIEDKNHQLLPQQSNRAYLRDFELNSEVVKNVLKDAKTEDNEKYIEEKFEYGLSGAYSLYNWELFFHIPFLLANRFLIEGNYKEALKWMHYIFDPRETEGDTSAKYWKFKPFADYNSTVGIDDLLFDLNMNGIDDPENVELNKQIEMWSNDPFKPHNIAQMRPGAYMKAVVMRYLDIIFAHGDDLFRIDTTESINEAMQYYMIAAQLLGRKPEVLETEILAPKSYAQMKTDGMGNAIEYFEEGIIKPENAAYLEKYVESSELEIASKPFSKDKDLKGMLTDVYGALEHEGDVAKLYFGIPKNDKMLAYWDRVADRLFKVRNSLNIDGIKRTVALFAPPIDPGLLIRARQAGLNIADVMALNKANQTDYRFQTLLQRALEICSEVKSLGSQLLSALEKGDTEYISVLRASHEKTLTEQVTKIKEKSIEEAEVAIEQVKLQQENTQFRESYYRKKKKISGKEQQQLNFMDKAMKLQVTSQALQLMAGSLSPVPDVEAGANGFGGSPVFTTTFGGTKLTLGGTTIASAVGILGTIASHKGSKAGLIAGYERRKEDWTFQADVAKREMEQLKQQELSAEIRKAIAELDQANHLKQVEQTQKSYEVLSSKFTNEQLYLWMAGEINTLYRSAFDMAYKMAKQAEAAYNFELCPDKPRKPFATDFFSAQNKGLLAGEKLYMELRKMEADYLSDNKRKFELTKHVSMAMLDPQKILDLRSGGTCSIELPEVLFDLDHPGHINRRIKSVSLTIPCVAGAYTSISADLTLIGSSIVTDDKGSVLTLNNKITRMATSNAVNDSGLFELNFNDARYLPFEGSGVASQWVITLPNNIRQFDYNSINDVIMHINYTAVDAGNRATVENDLVSKLNDIVKDADLASMFSLKAQYPEAWAKVGTEDVIIELKKSQLPFYLQGQSINVTGAEGTILSGKDQTAQALTNVATGTMGTSHSVTIPATADVSNADDLMIVLKYKVAAS
ncbi:hypothetical protein EO244_04240 [Ancylomarina salipaludis]|uniref:Virulence plasmid A protein n=1 Tax=Ancylomarina salipaludis TaxID=2501299 RepID=A0A4Q1JN18_9BACT|nr:neuraminidase-like domain-containing protein [Ancylomarina salipaludis]RXQ96058.1 hypothetical protein EO244_04240 [Ancylomarina salipaludis]